MSFFRKNLKQDILNGLVGWWKFDEKQGLIVIDSSGKGNHGTLVNNPTRVTGKIGRGLNFNGVNNYVTISVFSQPTSAITMSAWANFAVAPTGPLTPTIVSNNEAGGVGIQANISSSNRVETYFHINGAYVNAGETFSSNMTINVWYFITATFDGANTRYYRNAVLKETVNRTGTLSTTAFPMTIGYNPGAIFLQNNLFNGKIDDVRIYNRALSTREIQIIYNSTKDGYL